MTTTPATAGLAEIFATTTVVLLDFDGPTCDVFAGYAAHDVAQHLRQLLAARLPEPLPDDVLATGDPLHIIRRVSDLALNLTATVDADLRAAELQAVASSTPTPGTLELLATCRAVGRPVAIVSNNSADAIRAYLDRHGLTELVQHIQGRDPDDPHRMKPNPYSIERALTVLGVDRKDAVLIGDSEADLDAARAADIRVIAYANKPYKLDTLAQADALTTSMDTLADLASAPVGDEPPGGSTDIWEDVDALIVGGKNIQAIKAISSRMKVPLRLALELINNRIPRLIAARPEDFGKPSGSAGRSAHT